MKIENFLYLLGSHAIAVLAGVFLCFNFPSLISYFPILIFTTFISIIMIAALFKNKLYKIGFF